MWISNARWTSSDENKENKENVCPDDAKTQPKDTPIATTMQVKQPTKASNPLSADHILVTTKSTITLRKQVARPFIGDNLVDALSNAESNCESTSNRLPSNKAPCTAAINGVNYTLSNRIDNWLSMSDTLPSIKTTYGSDKPAVGELASGDFVDAPSNEVSYCETTGNITTCGSEEQAFSDAASDDIVDLPSTEVSDSDCTCDSLVTGKSANVSD
ncbi:unnamed protein product [Mesocestoides corti]|nr:unnamed protein product [Mesocestoides corti]